MTYPQVKSNFLFSVSLKGYELNNEYIYYYIYVPPQKNNTHVQENPTNSFIYSFPGILIIIEMNVRAKFIQPFLQGLYL